MHADAGNTCRTGYFRANTLAMKHYILFAVFLAKTVCACSQNVSDTSFSALFENLPVIASTADEAWKTCYTKNKITPAKQYEQALKQQVVLLWQKSGHKSQLLSMLAGKYNDVDNHIDFSKIKNEHDKELEAAVQKANTEFFIEQDRYQRRLQQGIDSALRQFKGLQLATELLKNYRQHLPAWIAAVKKLLHPLHKRMVAKGYNKLLVENTSNHHYYIHVLEARGLLLDRLIQIVQQIESANQFAAGYVENCKKNPGDCN